MTEEAPDPTVDDRVRRRLQDLEQFGADAAYTVSVGDEAFLADTPQGRVLRNNGRHLLIQVARIVEKLPDEYKRLHDAVDWVAIGRMRNLIAHHYDKVDDHLVFAALARRVPDLLNELGLSPMDETE